MDYVLPLLAALMLVILLVVGWIMTLLSLPGNWLIVAAVCAYSLLVPDAWRVDVGWIVVGVIFLVAVIGEILEWLTVAVGTSRAGGSKRAALLALCGSVGGGIVGAVVGLPIPIVGSVIAIVLFAAIGATCGAMVGESWKGRSTEASWEVGKAAFWGRLLGTMAKIGTACVIVVVVGLALVLR
jgi:hypothetical protein